MSNDKLYSSAISDYISRGYSKSYFEGLNEEGKDTTDVLADIVERGRAGEELTDAEAEVFEEFESEWPSFASQRVLGTEEFVRHLIKNDLSAVERILGTIQDIKKALKNRNNPDAKKAADFVKKAEKLYMDGLEEIGAKYVDGKIAMAERDEEEKVIVELEENAELEEIIANSKESTSEVLKDYLFDKLVGRTFTMSDGRRATIDKNDAKKLSYKAGPKKQIQVSNLERLIEQATYVGSDYDVEHKKFIDFHYYAVTATYKDERMDLLINVGTAKNDGLDHIYAITNNIKEEAPTHYGVSGPVGNRKKSTSSNNSISQTEEKSTLSEEKVSSKIRESRKIENKTTNTVDLQNEKVYNDTDPNGLTDDEIGSILAYKSGESYTLNAKLRDDIELDEYEQEIVNNLDKALEKLPTYKGKVYRDIQFDGFGDGDERNAFVEEHIIDDVVQYSAYTSTSTKKDGYPLDVKFAVHFEIESVNGRNLEGYGNNFESEVLFSRNSNYFTDKIEYDSDGTPTIYLTEVANEQQETQPQTADERGTQGNVQGDNSGKSRSRTHSASGNKVTVQSVQGESSEKTGEESAHNDLQDISERNAAGTSLERTSLRGVQTKVKHSHKGGTNKVSVSELQLAKLKANYEGQKVFNQTDVTNALNGITAFSVILPPSVRKKFISDISIGYNKRLDAEHYMLYSELVYNQLHARILMESEFELSQEEIFELDEQIVAALQKIVDSAKDSTRAKLEYSVSKEGLKKQADYWREEHDKALAQIKIRGRILNLAQKIKDLKTGAYVNASRYKSETFKGTIEKLARIQFRGNMNDTGTRNIIGELNQWYDDKENALYSGVNAESGVAGRFNNQVNEMMTAVANETNSGFMSSKQQKRTRALSPVGMLIRSRSTTRLLIQSVLYH